MKSITKLSIKLLSIYFLIEFISTSIPTIFGFIFSNTGQPMNIVMIVITAHIIKLIITIFLWYFADKLSNIMINDEKNMNLTPIDYNKLQKIAFSVVGLIILATNIPDFIKSFLDINKSAPVTLGTLNGLLKKLIQLCGWF